MNRIGLLIGSIFLVLSTSVTFAQDPQSTDSAIIVNDSERIYRVYVPSGLDFTQEAVPLVLMLHGFTSNMDEIAEQSQMNTKADVEGFIVAYAQAESTFVPSWDTVGNSADVAFVDALLNVIIPKYNIDRTRVYASGHSQGGGMVARLACDLSDRFAAIAPVSGAYTDIPPNCARDRAMPLLSIHSQGDPTVPYDGFLGILPNIQEWTERWALTNRCGDAQRIVQVSPDWLEVTWDDCQAPVTLITVNDATHSWFGGRAPRNLSPVTDTINATDRIWEFFEQHQLP